MCHLNFLGKTYDVTYKTDEDWEWFIIRDLHITFQGKMLRKNLETKLKDIEMELYRRYLRNEYSTYHLLKVLGTDEFTVEEIVLHSDEESKRPETKEELRALEIHDSPNLSDFVAHSMKDNPYYFLPVYLSAFMEEGFVKKKHDKYRATKAGLHKLAKVDFLLYKYMNAYKAGEGRRFGYIGF